MCDIAGLRLSAMTQLKAVLTATENNKVVLSDSGNFICSILPEIFRIFFWLCVADLKAAASLLHLL